MFYRVISFLPICCYLCTCFIRGVNVYTKTNGHIYLDKLVKYNTKNMKLIGTTKCTIVNNSNSREAEFSCTYFLK